jgi:hypothetical protein
MLLVPASVMPGDDRELALAKLRTMTSTIDSFTHKKTGLEGYIGANAVIEGWTYDHVLVYFDSTDRVLMIHQLDSGVPCAMKDSLQFLMPGVEVAHTMEPDKKTIVLARRDNEDITLIFRCPTQELVVERFARGYNPRFGNR